MILVSILTIITYVCSSIVKADVNSGCPSWGCLPSGSFSLSSGVPPANGTVKWSTEILNVRNSLQVGSLRGCVSDQVAVVCSTQSGYVSMDPITGIAVWNTTSMNDPYLPIMDVYGNLIGTDQSQMVYVDREGFESTSINIADLKPAFSGMLANNSVILLTSSNTDTVQVVTYNTDGVVCGAVSLTATVGDVNGTFLPVGHPIIVGFRAYVITQFEPNVTSSQERETHWNLFRLYAFDLLNYMTLRIRIVWFIDIQGDADSRHKKWNSGTAIDTDVMPPIVAYLQDKVYVNIPFVSSLTNPVQPLMGTLWGILDNGDTASFVFKTIVQFGQIVVYNVNLEVEQPSRQPRAGYKTRKNTDQTLWISSKYSNLIGGYSSRNGNLIGYINTTRLANIDQITSKLAITRLTPSSLEDILIFGGTDTNGSALLVAIETDSTTNAALLLKTKLSDKNHNENNVTWEVTGQIVNFAQAVSGVDGSTAAWQVGLIAMVWENGTEFSKLHVKGVY
ncbi:unnamed protein product [Candidula unifasciata]|uniref:Uncharacterized protein n=1 Tax=Candidula unifasciata TaxID=100452 RepID=A0A8S3YUG9_9EUPU|nr:unnamed protein product [Candidula unifasciata]